jgi:hypothetical protein
VEDARDERAPREALVALLLGAPDFIAARRAQHPAAREAAREVARRRLPPFRALPLEHFCVATNMRPADARGLQRQRAERADML